MSISSTGPRPPGSPPRYNQQYHASYDETLLDHRLPAIKKYAFCLCLHVKPTTLFIAAFKMIDALLLISNMLNSELSFEEQASSVPNYNGPENVHRSTIVAVGIITRSIMASSAAVAIYAVMSARAALLMPLYSVLLIEFFFALPSFYARDVDMAITSDTGVISMKNHAANNDQFSRFELFFSTVAMITKIYCLCAIWKCYRYLRLIQLVDAMLNRQQVMDEQMRDRQAAIYGLPDIERGHPHYDILPGQGAPPPPYESIASNAKSPPNYEEAIKPSTNIYTIEINSSEHSPPSASSI